MATDIEMIVQRQLDAYNRRDLSALLSVYAPEAEMFEHPSTLVAKGRTALGERFTARFKEPNLKASLTRRICMGNIVVDHESVQRTFPEGPGTIELVMIYEIQSGLIVKAWVLAGPKTFDK